MPKVSNPHKHTGEQCRFRVNYLLDANLKKRKIVQTNRITDFFNTKKAPLKSIQKKLESTKSKPFRKKIDSILNKGKKINKKTKKKKLSSKQKKKNIKIGKNLAFYFSQSQKNEVASENFCQSSQESDGLF